jgi:hypothetical protein
VVTQVVTERESIMQKQIVDARAAVIFEQLLLDQVVTERECR